MAIWQFDSWLYPRDRGGEASNWPDPELAKAVVSDLALILPEITNHYGGKAWGAYNSNIITVISDEDESVSHISFRVDLSVSHRDFVRSIIHIAQQHDLLLFTQEQTILSPVAEAFFQALDASDASRFVRESPNFRNYLKEIQ